ncbi:unnamed protein product [Phyllotreta striolata]|uniref:BRCT domain-containing protein n=1 Tax=Phyllotreta striolata TaxID=444603 RepID=A0A9N9TDZ7_PHYSR|nr:unnamed protein product [Phyllotreta striolata]
MEDIRIIFVLPESHEDETQCSDIMQSSFEYCKQNVPSEVEWLRESALQSLELKKTDFVVFDEFKGEYFNYVNSTKCAIVGPKALSYCLLEGKPIPNFDWPIYNVAMYDCIVTCSFLPKELKLEMKNKIQLMGGYYSESLVEKTTHLIAGSAKSQKYLTAAETGKKLMQTTWVEEVWKLSQTGNVHADNKEFEKHRCPPFHNLVICSSGITDLNDKRKIENLVNEGGGKFTGKLRVAETDFLVCVNVSWIIDSVKNGYALPHEPYQIQKMTSTPTKIDCPINPDFSVLSAIGNATAAQRMSIDDTNIPGGAINSPANNKRKVSDTLGNLLGGISNSGLCKAVQQIEPMDSEQFREISSRDESFVPLTQDAESEINKFFDHLQFFIFDFNTKPLKNCVITTSTYVAQERIFLQNLIEGLGATVQDLFSRIDKDSQNLRANTHLVSSEAQGKKYNAAQKWGLPVINKDWLIECVRTGKKVEEDEYILDKVSKNKEQSGNWSSQTGGVSTSNAPGAENVPTTPVSDKARKEYTVPPVWSLMKTPETPYDARSTVTG